MAQGQPKLHMAQGQPKLQLQKAATQGEESKTQQRSEALRFEGSRTGLRALLIRERGAPVAEHVADLGVGIKVLLRIKAIKQ